MLKILKYFTKIKEFFCRFLTNKKTLILNEGIMDIEEDILPIDIDIEDNLISSSMFDSQEKSDFFAIYENVKNGIIKLNDLLPTEMIQIELMMQEEMKLLNKKTAIVEEQLVNLNITRNTLEKEEQYYYKKYKKSFKLTLKKQT